ncbi:very short patch repair endonuclease [Streptomyces sp. DSM 44917]|uniref:Very short patch repair endonuclease n=2 Tax=Streptomyces boetiae TaxID=3075541 RepID=A0ABU2LA46_9ACTN|nr:very short patch repair endonuclease [Streptomyces sp. DSM 44917]MDT0308451.1 very short patch repair endonuclease [Streptomyces sp. DSM 44917]
MRRQRREETGPELAVRRLLHAAGLRYRLHHRVPGMARRRIDIAFPGPRIAVFLDGCFWHCCPQHASYPKANAEHWRRKFEQNTVRDTETTVHLQGAGWTVLRFWEHESPEEVAVKVADTVRERRTRPHGSEGDSSGGSALVPEPGRASSVSG